MNRRILLTLMLAVFTISAGYSVVLPLLPKFIEEMLGAGGTVSTVSLHTGFLTGIYTLALFLFAPAWGRLSDRFGRLGVVLAGLLGFAATFLALAYVSSLAQMYLGRFLNGIFASAIAPVAGAAIREHAPEEARGRGLALLSMAGIAGFFFGPTLGVAASGIPVALFGLVGFAKPGAKPLIAMAWLAILAGIAVGTTIPRFPADGGAVRNTGIPGSESGRLLPALHILAFIVSFCVGVFEVGLALRGMRGSGLTASQIALMFTECSAIMFAAQAVVFSPYFNPVQTRWLIAPAFLLLAVGLLLVNWASDYGLTLATIGGVSASAGVLSPVLTYWVSMKAGTAQGWELGKQTAAASLGMAMGSAAGGLLFVVPGFPGGSFLLASGFAAVGALLSWRLPRVLLPAKPRAGVAVQEAGR